MFVRYVVADLHEKSTRPMGVFQAAYRLRDRGVFSIADQAAYFSLTGWFDVWLDVPTRFSRSRRPRACPKAICWFKPEAINHIERVRRLAKLLERYGMRTRLLKTGKPRYIVYEDEHQVVAVPFSDTAA
jgi:hypothetical protein